MNSEELKKILDDHRLWLNGEGGERANLQGADLWRANLWRADLQGADLWRANLAGANLQGANLQGANLQGANLQRADLQGANLAGADLQRANLWGANLQGANLQGANLWGANLAGALGDSKHIKTLFISSVYPIVYTDAYLQIGCEKYLISDWWGFDDKRILEMDGKQALRFWREYKETIQLVIEKHPAEPTGVESNEV